MTIGPCRSTSTLNAASASPTDPLRNRSSKEPSVSPAAVPIRNKVPKCFKTTEEDSLAKARSPCPVFPVRGTSLLTPPHEE
jgi:hypothetical protein